MYKQINRRYNEESINNFIFLTFIKRKHYLFILEVITTFYHCYYLY